MRAPELVLMCGIPRSGKSTYAKHLQAVDGHLVICPDQIRSLIFGHIFRKEVENLVWFLAEAIVRIALSQGYPVVLDATNTHEKALHKWNDLAEELGVPCRLLVIDTPQSVITERNQGSNAVPSDVLVRMAEQFERFKKTVLPSLSSTAGLKIEYVTL